jgi:hypothetical protein
MATNQETVNNLIRGFVDSESYQGKTSSTRIKYLNPTRGEKQLDILARLLTNRGTPQDTCIAVFLKKNGQLLIASNLEEPRYARGYLNDLRSYILASSEHNHNTTYSTLARRAVQQIFSFIQLSQRRQATVSGLEKLEEFRELIKGGKERSWPLQQLRAILDKKEEVYQEFGRNKTRGWLWDYLLPLIDTDEVANNIRDEVFDQGVIKAIKERDICYVNDKLNMHAEMKILNKLYDSETKRFPEVGYIGITKLCCFPCQTMIYIINSKEGNLGNYFFFHTCGTHASTYLGWIIPDFYQEDFIESLERFKKWESSSEIPRELPLDPYGEFRRDWVSIHKDFLNEETKNRWSEKFSWSELKVLFNELAAELFPKKDLEFVLWMKKEGKISIDGVLSERLTKLRAIHQLQQKVRSQTQIPPK